MNGIGFRLWLANKEIFNFADRRQEYSEGEFLIYAKPASKTVFSFSFLYITTSSTSYVYVLSTLRIEHWPPSCSYNSPYSVQLSSNLVRTLLISLLPLLVSLYLLLTMISYLAVLLIWLRDQHRYVYNVGKLRPLPNTFLSLSEMPIIHTLCVVCNLYIIYSERSTFAFHRLKLSVCTE